MGLLKPYVRHGCCYGGTDLALPFFVRIVKPARVIWRVFHSRKGSRGVLGQPING